MELPVYKIVVNEDDDTGVDVVSFVERPAIQKDFMLFNQQFVEPGAKESEDEFIGRCIPYMIGEGMEQDQAAAVCYSKWQSREKMAGEKISIDYDDTLSTARGKELAKELIADARKAGLVTVLWVYPRGEGLIKGQERAVDVIAYGVALGVSLGAHIVKVKLPLDGYGIKSNQEMGIYNEVNTKTLKNRVALVMKAAYNGHRIVIHSGGDFADAETLEEEIKALRDGGAFGTIMGRNAFQRPKVEALDLISDLQDILIG